MYSILDRSSKLTVALLLFSLAFLIWGIKVVSVKPQKRLAAIFVNGIKNVIEFGDRFFPPQEEQYSLELRALGNTDIITVNRRTHKVSSKKNFIYHYKWYTVKCEVTYSGKNTYTISCGVK